MNLFSFIQKVKYRWKAKSRHGVHSPFVYDFVEKILNGKVQVLNPAVTDGAKFPEKQKVILERICHCYGMNTIRFGNQDSGLIENEAIPVLYVYTEGADLGFPFKENDIVVVLDINSTENKCNEWTGLCQNKAVRLSIDIFEMGFLFFRKDFLAKQHFILKY